MNEVPIPSPKWSSTTKLLAGLVFLGLAAYLLYHFSSLLTPLLMILLLVYLLHPLIRGLSRVLHISWKAAVNILYLLIMASLIGLLAWGGVGLVQQVQNLIGSVQDIVTNLPTLVEQLSTQVIKFGPFQLDLQRLDLTKFSDQILSFVQPLLGQTGSLVGTLASGAAEVFGWTFFVLIVSYFIMIESSGLRRDLFKIDIPGYAEDIERLSSELGRIWNAFLRGQLIIFVLAVTVYSIVLPVFGVRYALGIALMAGLAKFLPYVGPFVTWVVMALVTFFQPYKPFDINPFLYSAFVVVFTLITDQVIDNFIAPRIMARALKVHPAAVLITALIAADLLGLLGVIIAAPFLASVTLLGRYSMRKMFDLNPWPPVTDEPPPPIGDEWLKRLRSLFNPHKKTEPTKENSNGQQ